MTTRADRVESGKRSKTMPPTLTRKNYVYKCKCGKEPMRGYVTSTDNDRVFEILDRAFAMSHTGPKCVTTKTVTEPKQRTKNPAAPTGD